MFDDERCLLVDRANRCHITLSKRSLGCQFLLLGERAIILIDLLRQVFRLEQELTRRPSRLKLSILIISKCSVWCDFPFVRAKEISAPDTVIEPA